MTRQRRNMTGATMDADAPFTKYADAGYVAAQFDLSGSPPFWGYHRPSEKWNGWATPRFTVEVAKLIGDWLNDDQPGAAHWDGTTLVVQFAGTQYADHINPDDLGLYQFSGWTWTESDGSKAAKK